MKKLFFLFFLFCYLFSACSSIKIPVPGEKQTIVSNIYSEYYNIGEAYLSLAKYDQAVRYFTMAMGNKKLYWSCVYKCARACALGEKWDDARKYYIMLSKRDPDNLDIKLSLAYISAMSSDVKRASKIYERLFELYPDNDHILENYINIELYFKNTEHAKQLLKVLKEKFSDNKNISTFENKIIEIEDNVNSSKSAEDAPDAIESSEAKPDNGEDLSSE